MNDSKIAAKLRAQLKRFSGELLPHFSKPKTAFLGDMFYGLMAGGDVKLSKICRAYRPTITMKKAGDRLCMHLDDERIEKTLHSFIARKVARRVKPDTLIIVDPSDIQKPYATQMDFRHLKNMTAIVLATAYFCMTWIGNSDKRTLIAKAITDASLRIHELPEFHFYAIAEGIRMLLSRCGRWLGFGKDDIDDKPDLFTFFACDE